MLGDVKGQSALVVMVLTMTIFLLCSAVLALGINTGKIAASEINQEKAYYIAEAGVEKVLAAAKGGPSWLRNLRIGREYNFLTDVLNGEKAYGEGIFTAIKVKKLAEDQGRTILEIKCRGKCGPSTKGITVEAALENIYPEDMFRGLWLANTDAAHGHIFNLEADAYFAADVMIAGGSSICGNLYCNGFLGLHGEEDGAVEIKGDIYALDGVGLTGAGPFFINGNVYVDDIEKAPVELADITVVLSTTALAGKIPDRAAFPAFLDSGRLGWYSKNAGYCQLPPVTEGTMLFQPGIYFLAGDCTLSGSYEGNTLLVVDGNVTLGNLIKNSTNDSLVILVSGPVNFTGNGAKVDALLYAGEFNHSRSPIIGGSLLAENLAGPGTMNVIYDQNLLDSFRHSSSWTTCFVRIIKWYESV